jgi:hypothetical protein
MVEDIKVGSIVEDVKGETPLVEKPVEETVALAQTDIVAEIVPSEWKVLNSTEKQTFVATLVNDNLDVLVAEKAKGDALQKIIDDEAVSYKALEEEYRLKRIALEKSFAELKTGVV